MQVAGAEITHRRVLTIAFPIVLSNATVPLLGAVNTGVIGQMGQAAPLGAVGLGAITLASIYWIFGFLRMGTSGLAAQAHGAGDLLERNAIFLRGLGIGLLVGLVMVLLHVPLIALAFHLAPASAEVESLAAEYLAIRIWGAPATIALYAVTGWLIALERTRDVLILQIWINGLNILLDLWFVLGLEWGVSGVASATLIAEYAGLALGLWLCRAAFGNGALQDRARLFAASAWKRMVLVNSDIMLRSVLLQGSLTAFLFLGSGMGDVTLAANQVLLQFMEITAYALDGFAFAAEALVGHAVGARRRADMRRASLLAVQWGAAGAVLLALVFWALGPMLIDTLTTSEEVRVAARDYLPYLVLMPLVGVIGYMMDGIFIGATQTRRMRNTMIQSVGLYLIALAIFVPSYGNHGLWMALLVLNGARSITMARHYNRVEAASL